MHVNRMRRLRSIFALLILTLLNACGGVVLRSAHPFDVDDEELKPAARGYLVARVQNNASLKLTTRWTDLVVTPAQQDPDSPQAFLVPSIHAGESSSILFFGVLPAGDYAVSQLRQFLPGSNTLRYAPAPATLGTFSIVPGRMTDLSVLLYQPLSEDRNRGAFSISRDQDGLDLFPQIAASFPDLATQIARDRLFGWRQESISSSQQTNDKIRDYSLRHPNFSAPPSLLPSGHLVGLSSIGEILVRMGENDWQLYDTGYRIGLNDLVQLADGSYLVAAELGLLLHSQTLAGPWRELDSPIQAATLVQLHQDSRGGLYVLVRRGSQKEGILFIESPIVEDNEFQLYYRADPLQGSWEALELPADIGYGSGRSFVSDELYLDRNGRSALRYSLITRTSETLELPLNLFRVGDRGEQFTFSSAYNDKPGQILYRDSADASWQRVNYYLDGLPFRDSQGRWFLSGREVIKLAEGSRKTIPGRDHHIYRQSESGDGFEVFADSLTDCESAFFTRDLLSYRWNADQLWGFCLLDAQLYRYDESRQSWLNETLTVDSEDTLLPDA